MTAKIQSALKGVLFLALLWLLFVLLTPSGDGNRARAELTVLQSETRKLDGQPLGEQELKARVATLRLQLRTNRYIPAIEYSSPTHWTVWLRPEKRVAYINPHSLPYRVLFLSFDQMKFPDVQFGCPAGGQSQTIQRPMPEAPRPDGHPL